ncbi:MAG: hypothetical protein MUP02_08885 [Actinobacteria bacterium]|nr:hypothetical protein [Actinomycetota bacterium]
MKSLRKILLSSLVLIIIGIVGLFITLFIGNIGTGISNFGAGRGYSFSQEDMGHMSRDFPQNENSIELTFEDVKDLTHEYIERNNLSGLEIAEIMEFSKNFYIEVHEIDTGIGALELLVDKSSGVIFPEYGPNMMWNIKYGMHSQIPLSQNDITMDISEDKALGLAERYLAKTNIGELAGDEVEKFYGYYTIHTLTEDGDIAGMLSVNGFTGDVWYHNWHGIFIDMTEEH